MLRRHFGGLEPFVLIVALLCLGMTAMALSPSSYGVILRNLGAEDDGVLFGQPRGVRSDESALWTPMLQATVADGFGQINESSPYRESRRHFSPLPLHDWGLLFKPTFWPFLLLPPAFAYAGYFAAYAFLFLVGYYLLSRRFGSSAGQAALVALLLFFSSFVQTWWTSLGHHVALLPWILLIYLFEMPSILRGFLAMLTTAAWFLAGIFYPPMVWTLLLVGLVGLWAFRPQEMRIGAGLWARQVAMVLGLAMGAVVAYLYLREPLAVAAAASGYGQRNLSGGSVPWQDFVAVFFPGFQYSGTRVVVEGWNFCESSSAGSILWPLLLVFLDYRGTWRYLRTLPERGQLIKRALVLVGVIVFFAGWMLAPLPPWVGKPFLWHLFPNTRLLFPIGLLTLWLALLLLPHLRFSARWPRFLVFIGLSVVVWWPTRVLATFELMRDQGVREALAFEWREHANTDLYPALLLLTVCFLALALKKRVATVRWLCGSTALAIAMMANALSYADFNPIQSAKVIFERPETPQIAKMRELQAAHPRGWLVIGGWEHLAHILNGYGFKAINSAFLVPETRLLRELFPDLDPGLFNALFNRYTFVQVGLLRPPDFKERLRTPDFFGAHLVYLPPEALLPETKVELVPTPPSAKFAEQGRLSAIRLEGQRLFLSFEGEINGTSGKTQVFVHLSRPGKIVDRWVRPRTDAFDPLAGLRLFSRIDLEVELEALTTLEELELCVITRDPGFGDFSIAPREGARSSCV